MKVTIDSSEPLEHTLRVLGAMYDVTLVVSSKDATGVLESTAGPDGVGSDGARRTAKKARAAQKRTASRDGGRASTRGRSASVSTAALRSWARQNGYTVAERGRLPGEIAAAYHAAQKV